MIIGVDASRAVRQRQTGTERYSRMLLTHLLAHPAAVAHTWWLYTDVVPDAATWSLPDHAQWRYLPRRRLWTHRTLARAVTAAPPDVLFIPAHVVPFVWPVRRLPPTVVTVHDLGYLAFPAAHPLRQRLYLDLSTRWSTHAAARVIAISHATAQDLQRHLHADPIKVRVIHEAPAPNPYHTGDRVDAVAERAAFGITRPYALYVGTIQPRKNLVRVLQAYEQLCATGEAAFDLVLVGQAGWLSEPIVTQARQSRWAAQIHLLGYVPDANLRALWAGARFFVFPSLYEGFGLPVLEAQTQGVPVMTATGSSLPEVAGDAAILVDPTDVDAIAQAMLRLSQDEALRRTLIDKGHVNVRRFSWEKAARETLAVLEEAAHTRR